MTSREPLPFDPIQRAAALWDERIGPSRTMAAVTSVMRVQQILLSAVDGALRPHGLTFARYEALVLLDFSRRGRLPMRVMGERLQLHPTSVTNIVDRLQADGLVRRVPHPTDRRATLVEVTPSGRAVLEDATKAVTDIDFGLTGLTPEEESQLTTLLSRVRLAAGDFTADDLPDRRTDRSDDLAGSVDPTGHADHTDLAGSVDPTDHPDHTGPGRRTNAARVDAP
jgi:DNA-binding MarR family transcriptional regulator